MKKEMFDELLKSVKEAAAIERGEAKATTRRKAIAGMAIMLGGIGASLKGLAQTNPKPAEEPEGTPEDQAKTSLHQEQVFDASPERIYKILLDSKQFAAIT